MRRKGVPCACDPCKGKNYVRAVNNVSPNPNGDFFINAGNGIGISEGENSITIINQSVASSFVAGDNIEINPSGDNLEIRLTDNPIINGTLQVNGDIIQNGAAYETHAEHVFTKDDYIVMRDGAVSGLPQGDYSGLQVKLYDGVNDGRLVIDNDGTARVGDVGDEQPLLTRDEAADLTDGDSFVWDAANSKAITAAIPSAIATALADKEDKLTIQSAAMIVNSGVSSGGGTVYKCGKICWCVLDLIPSGGAISLSFPTGFIPSRNFYTTIFNYISSGYALAYASGGTLGFTPPNGNGQCGTFTYFTS